MHLVGPFIERFQGFARRWGGLPVVAYNNSFLSGRLTQFFIVFIGVESCARACFPFDLESFTRPQSRPDAIRGYSNPRRIAAGNLHDIANPWNAFCCFRVPGLWLRSERRRLCDDGIFHAGEPHVQPVLRAAGSNIHAVDPAMPATNQSKILGLERSFFGNRELNSSGCERAVAEPPPAGKV